jgi:tight adherence protein C
MMLALLTALLLGGTAVALGLRAAFMPRIGAVKQLEQIHAYGFAGEDGRERSRRTLRQGVDGLATLVGKAVGTRSSRFSEGEVRKQLVSAGLYTVAPATFLGYRVLGTIAVPALFSWWASATGGAGSLVVLGGLCGAMSGWVVPMTLLRRRGERRFEQIETELPELVDLLVVTVEAGLGLNSAMQTAAQRLGGPLGDELRLTLQEQRMGLSTNEALTNMLARTETPSMRSFVRSVVQGETLGVSIGAIMRNLAVEMRKRRRQMAEERAQKAPIKILFPLVFLIFPAMFVVLLFPAAYTFMQAMGG